MRLAVPVEVVALRAAQVAPTEHVDVAEPYVWIFSTAASSILESGL